jgi:16S rRNA G966 N2-methylase RsmD
MGPQSVCSVCGWPRERVTQVDGLAGVDFLGKANDRGLGLHGPRPSMPEIIRTTLGWTDCGHAAYRPGHVLDPFGGSGTTAVAAALEGRDATLIDLDRRNVELVHRRLAENVRIVSEQHDGDTVTWTVEQATRSEIVAEAGGQMGLFAS